MNRIARQTTPLQLFEGGTQSRFDINGAWHTAANIEEDSVPASDTEADVLLRDNGAAAARLASQLVVPLNNNFVKRP